MRASVTEISLALTCTDDVVLAVPPWIAVELLPSLTVPDAFESILNVHYKIAAKPVAEVAEAGFIGLVNGIAEWVFVKPDHISVTVSAANKLIDRPAADLAAAIWPNVIDAVELDGEQAATVPPFRVIKERRATIVANAVQEGRRPGAITDIANLKLAGDWTDTGLPATIEGAIRSGETAIQVILKPPKPEKNRQRKKRVIPDGA